MPDKERIRKTAEKPKLKVEFEKKNRANTGCLRGVLYFLTIIIVSGALAVFAWNCANDVLALQKPEGYVSVTVAKDFTVRELSKDLAELGVIGKPWLFTLYCNFSHAEEHIEPGTYEIRTNLDYHALAHAFVTVSERAVVQVKVTEGKTLYETMSAIAGEGVSDLETLLAAAGSEELDYDFLEDVPMTANRLEGYLYPDTYLFYSDASPRTIFQKFLNNFSAKLAPSMRRRIEDIEYDLNDILTIASMVQMEAASTAEMYRVSQVIYNRLNSNSLKMLQIDATLVYLIGREKEVTPADIVAAKDIDSPYNTYMYEGLPPGPICSPSIEAIRAALYPNSEVKGEYYYALGTDGVHHFFKDEASFNKFRNSSQFANS